MPNYTQHNNLILPFDNENYDVGVANANNRAIDAALFGKVNKVNGKDLSTNDFTNEYKIKIDKLSNIFNVKGTVNTVEELKTILNPKVNDAYLVSDKESVYGYSSEQGWIDLGPIFNIAVVESEIIQKLSPHTATVLIPSDTTIENNDLQTLPLKYQVRQ